VKTSQLLPGSVVRVGSNGIPEAPGPTGRILKPGVRIAEEELPRAGTRIKRVVCLSRWIDGSQVPRPAPHAQVGASAERVLIEIQDEGGGLPTGNVNELFRAFEQRSADRTGMGLGLAFSRWGAEANDGRIYARNLPGTGCTFTVDLRIAVPTVAAV
jgi:signal transduction histidine kinase